MKGYNLDFDLQLVTQLQDFGIEYQDAVECLKACNNNIAKAADYFYSGELAKAREQRRNDSVWNEDQFHTDRYDSTLEPLTGPSLWGQSGSNAHYSIQGPDVLNPEVLGQQRPPSPINSALITAANPDQDADFARAVDASLKANCPEYVWDGQESGIICNQPTPSGVALRPARQDHYEESEWALTTTTAHEIYLDPVSPNDRKRQPGEPAFFKPSSVGYNLGPAFTIFHSIPAARQAMVAKELTRDDYGYNDKWWTGDRIEGSRIINIDVDKDETDVSEVVIETQRLMAFLSHTNRAYGSIESLARLPDVMEHQQGQQLPTFFKEWHRSLDAAYRKKNPSLHELKWNPFTSRVQQDNTHNPEQSETIPFQVLEVQVNEDLVRKDATIYEAIDALMWGNSPEGVDIYMDQTADIMCMTIIREIAEGRGTGIAIPTELYIDRYTKEFKHLVDQTKKQREELLKSIQNIEENEAKLTQSKRPNLVDTSIDSAKLLEAVIEYFETRLAISSNGNDTVMSDADAAEKLQPVSRMGALLKEVLDNLLHQLQDLSFRKEEAYKTLSELSSRFTSPETTSADAPALHKYTLRGICPEPTTFFVRMRSQIIQPSEASTSTELPLEEQWWSISWDSQKLSNDPPYEVKTVLEQDVLEKARYTGDVRVLLVYANEEAMEPRDDTLPDPLKKFVEQDNKAFKEETASLPADKGKRKRSSGNWWAESEHVHMPETNSSGWGPTFTEPSTGDIAFTGESQRRGFSPSKTFEETVQEDDAMSAKFTPGQSRRNSAIEMEDDDFNGTELSNWQNVDSRSYSNWDNKSPLGDPEDGYAFSGNIVASPGITLGDIPAGVSPAPKTQSDKGDDFEELLDVDEVMANTDSESKLVPTEEQSSSQERDPSQPKE